LKFAFQQLYDCDSVALIDSNQFAAPLPSFGGGYHNPGIAVMNIHITVSQIRQYMVLVIEDDSDGREIPDYDRAVVGDQSPVYLNRVFGAARLDEDVDSHESRRRLIAGSFFETKSYSKWRTRKY